MLLPTENKKDPQLELSDRIQKINDAITANDISVDVYTEQLNQLYLLINDSKYLDHKDDDASKELRDKILDLIETCFYNVIRTAQQLGIFSSIRNNPVAFLTLIKQEIRTCIMLTEGWPIEYQDDFITADIRYHIRNNLGKVMEQNSNSAFMQYFFEIFPDIKNPYFKNTLIEKYIKGKEVAITSYVQQEVTSFEKQASRVFRLPKLLRKDISWSKNYNTSIGVLLGSEINLETIQNPEGLSRFKSALEKKYNKAPNEQQMKAFLTDVCTKINNRLPLLFFQMFPSTQNTIHETDASLKELISSSVSKIITNPDNSRKVIKECSDSVENLYIQPSILAKAATAALVLALEQEKLKYIKAPNSSLPHASISRLMSLFKNKKAFVTALTTVINHADFITDGNASQSLQLQLFCKVVRDQVLTERLPVTTVLKQPKLGELESLKGMHFN